MNLVVNDHGASIEFDCAKGTIDEPLVLDRAAQFDVWGTYMRQGPGPERDDDSTSHSAHYTGRVAGDVLTLTIKLKGSDEMVGPFEFHFGKQSRIFKCA